ncbi:hypothetical protein FRB95_010868 [Tulasnella sp. JGI-2019a]|nr:hypothetical protein FRB95_010868 [Tulasnella sp. JGI-2019a]
MPKLALAFVFGFQRTRFKYPASLDRRTNPQADKDNVVGDHKLHNVPLHTHNEAPRKLQIEAKRNTFVEDAL